MQKTQVIELEKKIVHGLRRIRRIGSLFPLYIQRLNMQQISLTDY